MLEKILQNHTRLLEGAFDGGKIMKQTMTKICPTKIKTWDGTWNPVWGCKNKCPYCYAREMYKKDVDKRLRNEINYRTKYNIEIPDGFEADARNFNPVFFHTYFARDFPRIPASIFINSMSDPQYWMKEWIMKINRRISLNPMHTFFLLTKSINALNLPWLTGPDREKYAYPSNCWLGLTVDTQTRINGYQKIYEKTGIKLQNPLFLSIEPILEPIISPFLFQAKWIIIGAETGNRPHKIKPQKAWIKPIVALCQDKGIPLFMKDSLKEIWQEPLIQEYPDAGPKQGELI